MRSERITFPVFVALTGLAFSTVPVLAQATTGTIRGRVTDESKGALPGATVTVTNIHMGMSRTVLTDRAGRYAVLSLPAAPYVIRVEMTGFIPTVWPRITLEVAQSLDLDFVLKVAGVAEKVVVTAEAPLVNHDSAELSASMDPKRLVELPINGRDFTRFSLLVPGAVAAIRQINSVTFNGLQAWLNSYTIDGTDASAVFFPSVSNGYERGARLLTGSLDSIQEFKVHTASYQAEYGRAAGAVVNIVAKSGGNDVHGTLFEFLPNSAFDARDFFARPDQPKPLYILHQFGGNFSGPLVKNKTFYFVNYEGSRQHLGVIGNGTVPSRALGQRALATSPGLAPLLAVIPLGTAPTGNPDVDNYTTVGRASVREDIGSIKIDHRFSERDAFFARYNVNDTRVLGAALVSGARQFATDQIQDVPDRTTNATVQEQHIFSGNAINEFKLGLQRIADQVATNTPFPTTSITGLTILPGKRLGIGNRVDGLTSYQAIDHLSISHGPHAFKTGLEIRRLRVNLRIADSSSMTYDSLDGFARNSVVMANLRPATPGRGIRQTQYGFYFQDNWKARRHLTLNLGLRYEYFTVFREVRDRVQVFNPLTGDLDPPGARWYRPDRNNFAPRVGFAWSPLPSGKTTVRGGFGLYYTPLPAFFITIPINLYINNILGATTLLRSQIPDLSFPLDRFIGSGVTPLPSVNGLDPRRRDTYSEQWTLNLQQALGSSMALQVAYVGNRGINLYRDRNINLVDPALGRWPNPRFADITRHENTAQSVYHALQISLRRRFRRGLAFDMAYSYGHAIDDVDDVVFTGTVPGPQEANDLRAERGNSLNDIRHNLAFDVLYDLPFGAGRSFFVNTSGVLGQVLSGWQLNGIGIVRTGRPFNVELGGASPRGNGNTINQRPDRVAGISSRPAHRMIDHWLNRDAFAEPRRGTFGNLGRNTEFGPGLIQVDLSLLKTVKLRETKSLQFRAELFNVLNHPNFSTPQAQWRTGNTFGKVFSTFGRTIGFGTPRQIQFGLKYIF